MALTKEQRDALPADDFAVPGKRQLPMHDERHARLAWDMVDRTKGLTDDERHTARQRILSRAKTLGMDTADWSTIKAMALQAMSLAIPQVDGHPNRMPFSGVLTRIDQPSDVAPHGSKGRRVVLPRAVAEEALPSLLGMAVDFTQSFDGHDAQKKIGIITDATIEGDAIEVEGFIYAADFPDAAARIKASKDLLGFSYEMKNVHVVDPGADTLVIESCVFTGAAILRKADAAYTTTSLAASKDLASGDFDMTKEELEEILAAALKPVTDKIATIEASQAKLTSDLEASKETHAKVAPHADKLRACADGMQAAGIGIHETRGHVTHLRQMADRMEAEAMLGKVPHIYRDHDFFVDAGGDKTTKTGEEQPKADPAIEKLSASVEALGTRFEDLKTKAFNAAGQPERKTISPEIKSLLAKGGLTVTDDSATLSVAQVDTALEAAGVRGTRAIEAKLKLQRDGVIATAA